MSGRVDVDALAQEVRDAACRGRVNQDALSALAALAKDGERVRELEAALDDAIDFAQEGWGYADDYFQEKWHVGDEIKRLRSALGGDA